MRFPLGAAASGCRHPTAPSQDCTRSGRCGCSWQAEVFDHEAGEKLRRTFPTHAAARGWRNDALVALKQGRLRADAGATLKKVAEAWQGARSGAVRNQSGDRYAAGAIRTYERVLRLRVLPALGHRRMRDIRHREVQELIDELVAERLAAATIRQTVAALKAICRREVSRGRLATNPTTSLELPAVRNGRDHIVTPDQAAKLVAALPEQDRGVWAVAVYGGLRRGELQALTAADIDLQAGVIHVHRGWDQQEGAVATKGATDAGSDPGDPAAVPTRAAPALQSPRADLLFGATPLSAFEPRRLIERADAAWEEAGLEQVTLHEARHCYASYMIAAGVNAKALSTYMGHGNIAITLDTYGHMLPGNEDQAADLLDAFLTRDWRIDWHMRP